MRKNSSLRDYFPMIREREEILKEIEKSLLLKGIFSGWSQKQREDFLDYASGARGWKILYDPFFKEVLNVEYDRSRLEDFLATVLGKKVKILRILPNDSTRLADETSLLITDIVVELEDGSIATVEIQKIGYLFPGARCACYSCDMLLRQYKRVRDQMKKHFSYRDIRSVFLIVIYENSPAEFKQMPDVYYHHAKQVFDSGLSMDLLQEYVMIPLDIFRRHMQNKPIESNLEAWLTFFSEDSPEKIIELITAFPRFRNMYETLYDICNNMERVMEMFSKELQELDRNTTVYMIEEQQKTIEQKIAEIQEMETKLGQMDMELEAKRAELGQKDAELEASRAELGQKDAELEAKRAELGQKDAELEASRAELGQKDAELKAREAEIASLREKLQVQSQRVTSPSEKE